MRRGRRCSVRGVPTSALPISWTRRFKSLGLSGERIAMVSDIGCSGLFDTFFHTHAFHGLHGRALTYAAGLKLARPS